MSRHIPRFYLKHEQHLKNKQEKADFKIREDSFVGISGDQMRHAAGVLRLKAGDELRIFNGDIGEWRCEICDIKKCTVRCIEQIKVADEKEFDSWLKKTRITIAFALINPTRMSFLIEKVTELGVAEIVPIISQYTQQRKFNLQKAEQIAIGACEQSGRLEPPKVREVQDLATFLREFQESTEVARSRGSDGVGADVTSGSKTKKLFVADEVLRTEKLSENEEHSNNKGGIGIQANKRGWWFGFEKEAIFLIGPEGGFSDAERELFDRCGAQRISLGPNILRSETAAIAVASVLQTNI